MQVAWDSQELVAPAVVLENFVRIRQDFLQLHLRA